MSNVFVNVDNLNLTKTEFDIIDEYTSGESLWINNYLRERNLDDLTDKQIEKLKLKSIHLNNIIKKSPLSTNSTIVYRGAEAMQNSWRNLDKGDELVFTNKGIISTTFSEEIAIEFLEGNDCCLLVLYLPKGTRGLYISSNSIFSYEDELLLPHGSCFIVTERTYIKYDDKKILTYHANLISQ